MKKAGLVLCSVAGMVACVGCNGTAFFRAASDVTGTIVNSTLIAGALGLVTQIPNIQTYINQLLGQ
jgi:hypothetical protein